MTALALTERQTFTFPSRGGPVLVGWRCAPPDVPDAPTLVIVNAPGGTADAWRGFAQHASRGWHIVSWEYRGLRDEEAPSTAALPTVLEHADDLADLLDHLGVRRVTLVCWALGTLIGLDFASRHPGRVDALVAINGVPGRPFGSASPLRAEGLRRVQEHLPSRGHLLQAGLEQLRRFPRVLEVAKLARLVAPHIDPEAFLSMADGFARISPRHYARFVERIARADRTDTLRTLGCPALFIAGRRDPLIPAAFSERMAELAPDSELVLLPIGSHYVPVEFAEFLELKIEDFLVRRTGAAWLPPRTDAA